MKKRILVIGGTGAMGRYLVPLLIERGYKVDVVARDAFESNSPDLTYIVANAKDRAFMETMMQNGYDGIVDFMIYRDADMEEWLDFYLERTNHYIYLSTYRVYANEEHPIKEDSPRLFDIPCDPAFLSTNDYALYKARGENHLRNSVHKNWTIIRPAITYSSRRFQLVTLEMDNTVERAFLGKKVVLPLEAKDKQATMTWAGDVAKMIEALLLNSRAMCETYTVSTAEHHTWGEIAEYYRELCGLECVWVSNEEYLEAIGQSGVDAAIWQLAYDRLFDRVIDNSKILDIAGLKQEDLMPLREGLRYELAQLSRDLFENKETSMDRWLLKNGQ